MNKFITTEFEKLIYVNVINARFSSLGASDKKILNKYLYATIQVIATCYDFYSDIDNFYIKLAQNNYKDIMWILTYILPYIDERTKKISTLQSLSDLYVLRNDEPSNDINFMAPKYVYSNYQYGRCFRHPYVAREFDEQYMRDNYYILADSIKQSRYKLYINWIDIIPYRLDNYKESKLYNDSIRKIQSKYKKYEEWDPCVDYKIGQYKNEMTIIQLNKKASGLNVDDIYNCISIDLYESIISYKWLIYDTIITSGSSVIRCSIIHLLNEIFNLMPIITLAAQSTV